MVLTPRETLVKIYNVNAPVSVDDLTKTNNSSESMSIINELADAKLITIKDNKAILTTEGANVAEEFMYLVYLTKKKRVKSILSLLFIASICFLIAYFLQK